MIDRLRANQFLVLGRAGLDLYTDPPGTRIEDALSFFSALGGSAGNIAVAISKLGGRASIIGSISEDAVGRYTLNQLKTYGVSTEYMPSVTGDARTTLAVVETRTEDCQSVIYRNGASDFSLTPQVIVGINFSGYGALIVTGTALALEPSRSAVFKALSMAKAAGLVCVIDVDFRPYSWVSATVAADVCGEAVKLCDIIIGNKEEFAVLASGANGLAHARHLAKDHNRLIIYKMGEDGAQTFFGGQLFQTPVFPVTSLKPTGAGDAFVGGLMTSLAAGYDLEYCVRRGAAAAAIVVTRIGCAPAMPTTIELDKFMQAHGFAG